MSVDYAFVRTQRRAAVCVAAAIAVLAVVDPNTTHVPLCPFHSATGLDCPLCGGLRAVHALTRGAVVAAVRDNALVVAALPVLLVLLLRATSASRESRPHVGVPRAVFLVAVMLVFTVVRNLPFAAAIRPA